MNWDKRYEKGGFLIGVSGYRRRWSLLLAVVICLLVLVACAAAEIPVQPSPPPDGPAPRIVEGQHYLDAEDVALYLYEFSSLPKNFLTKAAAERLGWVPSQGNLWVVAPGSAIGGDRFGNREGLLPARQGRQYYECDVNYAGGYRGAERLVYSNDGLIFYTADHYESFELLYGEVDD
ncbi:MAG TPA: ribonuclease domain-containing protein [Bacillota bacterium]|nr:ribonuclease domain-containing protein [Bacillota bacterium]